MTHPVHVLLRLSSNDPERLKAAVEYLLQDGGGNRGNRVNGDEYVGIYPLNPWNLYDRNLAAEWLDVADNSSAYVINAQDGVKSPIPVMRE